MAAVLEEIKGLSEKQPLFQEFCKINGLSEGDSFKSTDYINWVDCLSLAAQIQIIRKYQPDFKLKNCNL